MANKKQPDPAPAQVDEDEDGDLTPEQLRAQLKKMRARVRGMEAIGKGSPQGLTHPHDIERLHRLNLLPPEDVARFQASGQLPGGGVPEADNVVRPGQRPVGQP